MYLIIALKLIVSLSILNVWLVRAGKATQWRGGEAKTLKEEFSAYGLPGWFMTLVGILKVGLSAALLASIWIPEVEFVSALGISVLMLGAIAMHTRVGDPITKSIPAFTFLALAVLIMLL
jgi:hypothetical protein